MLIVRKVVKSPTFRPRPRALLHRAVQERHDLCSRAGGVRHQFHAVTLQDPRSKRPVHRGHSIAGNRRGICIAGEQLLHRHSLHAIRRRIAEEERHSLRSRAGIVRAELACARAGGDAVFNGPRHGLGVVSLGRHIVKALHGLRLGGTGRTPKERDDLRAGAAAVRVEGRSAHAGGDVPADRPDNGVLIVSARGNIGEGVLSGGGQRLERGLHGDLAVGHRKGKLAVALVGELEFLVVSIQNGEGIEQIALVGIDRQGDSGALGSGLVARGHIAVLAVLDGDAVSGRTAAGSSIGSGVASGSDRTSNAVFNSDCLDGAALADRKLAGVFAAAGRRIAAIGGKVDRRSLFGLDAHL